MANHISRSPKVQFLKPNQWVDLYADYLFSFALSRLNNEELARDLVQDTFLAALESIDNFEGRSSEKTWLTAILRNKIFDTYRIKSIARHEQLKTDEMNSENEDFFESENGHWKQEHQPREFGINDPDLIRDKEFHYVMKGCLAKLPPLWAAVFEMKHVEDGISEDICSQLHLSPANFWVIIHRSKVNLRSCLQKNWIG